MIPRLKELSPIEEGVRGVIRTPSESLKAGMEMMMDCKTMLDRLGALVVATDPEGNIVYLNEAGERAFAKYGDRESMIGRNLSSCHKPETMTKIRNMYDAFKNGDKQPRFYLRDDEKGKRTVAQVPIYNGDELEGVMEIIFSGTP